MVWDRDYKQETYVTCYELGHVIASLLGEKCHVGVAITLLTGSPARRNEYQRVPKFT